MENESVYLSDNICRVDTKDKILEARNGLNVAYLTDYAMLMGCGGEGHARSSGIITCLTDHSERAKAANGNKAPFVSAVVPTSVFSRAKAVAEFNLGTVEVDSCDLAGASKSILAMLQNLMGNIRKISGGVVNGKVNGSNLMNFIGMAAAQTQQISIAGHTELPLSKDWLYTQERVNTYSVKNNPGGYANVSSVRIERKLYQLYNGAEQRRNQPWSVRVRTFKALPVEQANGTVAYDPNSVKEKKDVVITLTDDQMYDFCDRIEHFVNVWEMATGVGLVREALKYKEGNRKE